MPSKVANTDTTLNWWDRWQGRLRDELAAFERLNASAKIVEKKDGVLSLSVAWTSGVDQPLDLVVHFSPLHPFFRPRVVAPHLHLPRHQNPMGKELCLLTQDSHQWVATQLVADFLAERLPVLFQVLDARAEGGGEKVAALEENAPDPKSAYYTPQPENGSVVLFDGAMQMPPGSGGRALFKVTSRPHVGFPTSIEAVLTQLAYPDGKPVRSFDLDYDAPATIIPGRWVQMAPPATCDPSVLLAAADAEVDRLRVLQPAIAKAWQSVGNEPSFFTALLFEEEVHYGKKGLGAIFIWTSRNPTQHFAPVLVRGERASEADVFARLPLSRSLRRKSVLLVGCGAIGGFAAAELARAGIGKLILADRDHVQPGNSLRWPVGRQAWGTPKIFALQDFIRRNYPWTRVEPEQGALGDFDPKRLKALIEAVDLVVDASASTEVQLALGYYCRVYKRPYVAGEATLGLVGGMVTRFRPGEPGCWVCVRKKEADKAIVLREDSQGVVTPAGCNAPTFIGGAYDLQEVSMEIVRSAVGLLSDGAYDAGPWPIGILDMLDDEGRRTLPSWKAFDLMSDTPCPGCAP